MRHLRLAVNQMAVGSCKADNLRRVAKATADARSAGAHLLLLPECFSCPYDLELAAGHAEHIPGETSTCLQQLARQHGIWIVGGSIIEQDGSQLYNTCLIYDDSGCLVAKHRKVHLFDMNLPDGTKFQESQVFTAGNSLTTFTSPWGEIDVGICHDMRFPAVAQISAQQRSCRLLLYPAAFNVPTGQLFWQLLLRARAVDNQVFVAACCSARNEAAKYVTWGHSLVADPFGRIVAEADEHETLLVCDIDFDEVQQAQHAIPLFAQHRHDLYDVVTK